MTASDHDRGSPYDDLLPDRTSDESDLGWGDEPVDEALVDERLLADRPPHWDARE